MDDGHAFRGWALNVRESDLQRLSGQQVAGRRHPGRPRALKRDEWRHVAVTYDGPAGRGVRIYINGVEAKRASRRRRQGNHRAADAAAVGQRDTGENFTGALQEVTSSIPRSRRWRSARS